MARERDEGLPTGLDTPRDRRRLWTLIALLGIGVGLALWQPIALEQALAWGHELAQRPLTAIVLVLLQAVLLALALPGTLVLWVIAPFYHPALATLLLTAGSTLGALWAYLIARWLGGDWRDINERHRVIRMLARRGDFLTLLSLRVLPGFPHSIVNYGAGTLRLPLLPFLSATAIGLAIKWSVYATAVHEVAEASATGEPPGLEAIVPLLILALLLAFGGTLRRLLERRRTNQVPGDAE